MSLKRSQFMIKYHIHGSSVNIFSSLAGCKINTNATILLVNIRRSCLLLLIATGRALLRQSPTASDILISRFAVISFML